MENHAKLEKLYNQASLADAVKGGHLVIEQVGKHWYGQKPKLTLVSTQEFDPYVTRDYHGSRFDSIGNISKGLVFSLKEDSLKIENQDDDDIAHREEFMEEGEENCRYQDLVGEIRGTIYSDLNMNFTISCESVPLPPGKKQFGNKFVTAKTRNIIDTTKPHAFVLKERSLTVQGATMLTRMGNVTLDNIDQLHERETMSHPMPVYRVCDPHPVVDTRAIYKLRVLRSNMSNEQKAAALSVGQDPIDKQIKQDFVHGRRTNVITEPVFNFLLDITKDFMRNEIPLGNVTGRDLRFIVKGFTPQGVPAELTQAGGTVQLEISIESARAAAVKKIIGK